MLRPRSVRVLFGILLTAVAGALWPVRYGGHDFSRIVEGRTAQDQAAQNQTPQATFRTEANYVRVDVYPTQNGAPITDLTRSDFEVLDNGVRQTVEQFERVVVRAAGPQEARIEPNTVRESRSMLESARARVFVLFLDIGHVGISGSYNIRKPLVDALDRIIGADDLVGLMTPDMSARDVAFGRKTTTIDGILSRYRFWGERGRLNPVDPQEQRYEQCYPRAVYPGIAAQMIGRRREKTTLDGLHDLVRFLRGVREERKAILAISEGWLLYRPDPTLARPLDGAPPTGPIVAVDPRSGRLGIGDPRTGAPGSGGCDNERLQLAQIDDEEGFRRLLDEANRSNTSFYPVDPRGLAVFDTDIGPDPPPPPQVDGAMLRQRLTSLRTLAEDTDGLAIVNSNDIAGGLRRVVADLTSYYLLGYYSNAKLDGKFHSISVRVKRTGVQVRARRGYLAATEADARAPVPSSSAVSAGDPLAVAAAAEAGAVAAAVAPLEGYSRPLPIRLHGAAGWKPGNTGAVWTVGEIGPGEEWRGGGEADLVLSTAGGAALATAHATILPGTRTFRVALTGEQPLPPGDYLVRVRVKGSGSTGTTAETLRIVLPDLPDATGAIFIRRGPATGNKEIATADLRFRRSEQLRVELPTPFAGTGGARLLDRTGKALAVPITITARDDADGSRWLVTQLALAPLAPADYVIEMTESGGSGKRTLLGFRVVQ
ncbi:MAG: VWA domain-containing protein [Acidobacteriota bacterium]